VTVTRDTPYTFDLGNLVANDLNPVPRVAEEDLEQHLSANARDAAQALINQLLNTCEVRSTTDGVHLILPTPNIPLPREKSIPAEKAPTKWELFAKKKGIKGKTREGKMVYDEASGEWVPKWGYKGKNKDGDTEWLIEVDTQKETATGEIENKRAENRRERKERVRRNERKQRSNERNARKSS